MRNWLELPDDLICLILVKVGAAEILNNAQYVCSAWYDICKDPLMWCVIDMQIHTLNLASSHLEKMCRPAIDRSCGGLRDISLKDFASHRIYHSEDFSSILCLYDISDEGLIKAVSKLPSLEHLELSFDLFTIETLKAIGQCCPLLKTFKMNHHIHNAYRIECDKEALAIAGNMPNLRHLQMFGSLLTNKGLQAILDGCSYLESLDLRMCLNLNLEGRLGSICAQKIKILRLPDDPIDDYEFRRRHIIDEYYCSDDWSSDYYEFHGGTHSSQASDTSFSYDDDYYEFSGKETTMTTMEIFMFLNTLWF